MAKAPNPTLRHFTRNPPLHKRLPTDRPQPQAPPHLPSTRNPASRPRQGSPTVHKGRQIPLPRDDRHPRRRLPQPQWGHFGAGRLDGWTQTDFDPAGTGKLSPYGCGANLCGAKVLRIPYTVSIRSPTGAGEGSMRWRHFLVKRRIWFRTWRESRTRIWEGEARARTWAGLTAVRRGMRWSAGEGG